VASNAAVPDLVTRSLGVDHDWVINITDPMPLYSQREGRVAISPDGQHKAIWDEDVGDQIRVHDRTADPGEVTPSTDPLMVTSLTNARAAFEAVHPTSLPVPEAEVQLTEEQQDELRQLGYIGEP
jgi:hypothetical protein